MTAFVDTDVIVRILAGDDPVKASRSAALFEAAERGEVQLNLTVMTVADAFFVMTSPRAYAGPRRENLELLRELIGRPGVIVENRRRLLEALSLMRSSRHLDFGDAYTAAAVLEEMEPTVYSYDHDFDRIDGITRLEP